MFKKKQTPAASLSVSEAPLIASHAKASPVKNIKPKVLLMDLDRSVQAVLVDAGINTIAGSLGTPFQVEPSSRWIAARNSSQLAGYAEQEIIFIDLSFDAASSAVGEKYSAEDVTGIWIECTRGLIDSRAVAAMEVRDGFNRIVSTGGVVVVFASPKTGMTMSYGKTRGSVFRTEQELSIDEWSFLSDLDYIRVVDSHGEEISICEERTPLSKALSEYLPDMRFECTLVPRYDEEKWRVLAINKFGETVALARTYSSNGAVLILPQMQHKAGFIKRLLTDAFPEMFPGLFPGVEKGRWTHLPEYELVKVTKLQSERDELVKLHESEMERIAADISAARAEEGWLHDLLTQTGDPLVEAVVIALRELGFQSVVDMDKIRDREGKARREDLQIQDCSPTLVVDIKGINNFPGDEDAMQAFKHATLVMREQKRVDVVGLSIINHQRHLPPLQRDNSMPFRRELVDVAVENFQGLLTTWDLYRMVVNKRRNSWKPDDVKPVLYGHGRLEPVPKHYCLLGRIAQVWSHAFGVDIENSSVKVGDAIALEFDIYFEETSVASLQVANASKAEAVIGDKTGIPWPTSFARPKVGMRVFVIKAAASTHVS